MTLTGAPLQDSSETRWHVLPAMPALAMAVKERILAAARQAIHERGVFRIVLAGGSTPAAIYRLLADADTDWSCWQIYFGDERCLPAGHAERNSTMAAANWLDRVAIPPENIHPIDAGSGAGVAALAYAALIESVRPFDIVLLGMGEDGHTASLFPGQQYAAGETVHAVHNAPKPPPERVSLGVVALNDTAAVLVMISGAGKYAAVQRWQRGEDLPVARIHGQAGADVYIDRVAVTGETA